MIERKVCAPLQGLKILDLSRAVTGPFCTMLLGDLGARVIKIEEPSTGDETRHWGPPFVEGESAYFLSLNRNKESVVLDLKLDSDQKALCHMASQCDVVVQNFRPGVAERLGIDYHSLKQSNDGLIYASISGFGLSGPDRERPGYDLIVQAMSGMMLASGTPGEPSKSCFPVADVLAGQFACQGILAALFERQRTGRGNHIEVSLLESLLASMSWHATSCLLTGKSPEPQGTTHSTIVPYQLLQCQDKQLAVGVPNQRIWRRFCEALGRKDWIEDERFATNKDRSANRGELIAEIERVMSAKTAAQWKEVLDLHEVPCGPLLAVAEALRLPQVAARRGVVELNHPAAGVVRVIANPVRFEDAEIDYRSPPTLGEHTDRVLAEFGLERTVGSR